jgi:uncharacterized protein (TIGR02466 family)
MSSQIRPIIASFAPSVAAAPQVIPMSAAPNAEYLHLFPVPFVRRVWTENAELNSLLRLKILAHARQSRGEHKSNAGGWHSETGLLEFLEELREPLVRQMLALAEEATRQVLAEAGAAPLAVQWGFQAWANISRGGDSHAAHTHAGSTWSGVYYVDAGETEDLHSAHLEIIDPCLGRSNTFMPFALPSSVGIRPEPGLMVLFPSYVPHAVHVQKGSGTRISIAFNLRKEPFP